MNFFNIKTKGISFPKHEDKKRSSIVAKLDTSNIIYPGFRDWNKLLHYDSFLSGQTFEMPSLRTTVVAIIHGFSDIKYIDMYMKALNDADYSILIREIIKGNGSVFDIANHKQYM